jgi:hypothetical protein
VVEPEILEQLALLMGAQWKNGFTKKNCSSKFFSNWKSAEPVFCSEELSCLPYKNQNKSLTLSFGEGKKKSKWLVTLESRLAHHRFSQKI